MAPMESLWSAPESVLQRLSAKGRDTEWADFLLCGFYCMVAVTFLVIFGIAALLRAETAYALVTLSFAVITCIGYGLIWLTSQLHLPRHFVVLHHGQFMSVPVPHRGD